MKRVKHKTAKQEDSNEQQIHETNQPCGVREENPNVFTVNVYSNGGQLRKY